VHRINSKMEAECRRCLYAWSPAALPCIISSCPRSTSVPSKDGVEHQQLLLNDRIAATIQKCLGSPSRTVPYRAAVSGWVSPLSLSVHSWVEAGPAGGLKGLGVLSGRTPELKGMGDGDVVSAKEMVCDHVEGAPGMTLQQAVEPLISQQVAINQEVAGGGGGGGKGEDAVLSWRNEDGYTPILSEGDGGKGIASKERSSIKGDEEPLTKEIGESSRERKQQQQRQQKRVLGRDQNDVRGGDLVPIMAPGARTGGDLEAGVAKGKMQALRSAESALVRTLKEKEHLLDSIRV
jgi:hypothetical protein